MSKVLVASLMHELRSILVIAPSIMRSSIAIDLKLGTEVQKLYNRVLTQTWHVYLLIATASIIGSLAMKWRSK